MSNQNSAAAPWATLRFCAPISTSAKNTGAVETSDFVDRLDGLGGLIADLDGVGGVETLDPALFGSTATAPALVVYTTPPFLESVEAHGRALALRMNLDLQVLAEVRTDDDWRDSWKDFYEHKIFGDGDLLLRPSWLERRPDDPACELVLDPGRAFGTGYHESTRLCLNLLMKRAREGLRVPALLDLGCGSGILGLAWAKRCGDQVVELSFVDIDAEAVETTRENAQLNSLEAHARYAVGDAATLAEEFPLVIANIRPEVLVPHAREIQARVRPGGELVLSGILLEEADKVRAAYQSPAWELVSEPIENDWCAMLWRRNPE